MFERGVSYAKHDYLGHGVFDKYLAYEVSHGTPLHVANLYSRIMAAPLKDIERFHKG